MTSRWIWVAALAASAALGGCKERRAPAAASPAELVPADPEAATVQAAPTAAVDARSAGSTADAGSAAPDEDRPGKDGMAGKDGPSGEDRGAGSDVTAGKDGTPDRNDHGTPDEGDRPRKDGKAPAGGGNGEDGKASAGGGNGDRECGGVGGRPCQAGEKCRYGRSAFAPQHPDQMGACVGETYCDAPGDCEGLMHVMVVGTWACQKHQCEWKTKGGSGPQ